MAQKKYTISQKVELNGQKLNRSISLFGEPEDVTALVAKLAGIVTVKEENLALGNKATSAVESSVEYIGTVVMSHDTQKTTYFGTFDGKNMLFKSSVTRDDVEAIAMNFKPFKNAPTEKPKRATASGATVAVVSSAPVA